jgi:hypothetical protein
MSGPVAESSRHLRGAFAIRTRVAAALCLPAAALACLTQPAFSANWQFDPTVVVGGIYNDNYRVNPRAGEEVEVSGGLLEVDLTTRSLSEAFDVRISPRVRSTYFPDEKNQDANDLFLDVEAMRRSLRTKYGVFAGARSEDTVRSELPSAILAPGASLGQSSSGDAGFVDFKNRQDYAIIRPSISHEWSERLSLDADVSYTLVDYDRYLPGLQVGYEALGAAFGLNTRYTERSTITGRLFYATYEPDRSTASSNTMGADVRWSNRITENREIYARGGVARVRNEATGFPTESSTSYVGGVGTNWTFQRTSLFLDLARDVDPNSAGFVVERDELRFFLEHSLSTTTKLFGAARVIRDVSVALGTATNEREYLTGSLGFEWRVRRAWAFRGQYEYASQKYDSDPRSGTSNGVQLTVVYRPLRRE